MNRRGFMKKAALSSAAAPFMLKPETAEATPYIVEDGKKFVKIRVFPSRKAWEENSEGWKHFWDRDILKGIGVWDLMQLRDRITRELALQTWDSIFGPNPDYYSKDLTPEEKKKAFIQCVAKA